MKLLLENWRGYLNEEEGSLENWEHEDAKAYAKELIEKYGEPKVMTNNMVLWESGISKFKKVYVLDESIPHDSPKPHRDFVYSTMEIDVPEDLMEAVAEASESIIVDQLKNEVTARCGDIIANAITLGFVQKLVEGKIKPEDAKEEYKRHILEGITPDWFKETLEEKSKSDRCTRIAKRKYDVWPSAYASGAVVKCRQGKIWKDLKEDELDEDLRKWFGRKGAPGKKKGWVDCNTCRKDKKTGRKKCKACGREKGEKRSKYPACRPTPAACGKKGKGKSWGKKSTKQEKE